MNDFGREPAELKELEVLAVSRVLQSGRYVLGPELEAFETTWAGFCGTQGCVGVGNGLDAIDIGIRALGLEPGDEVITTAMTAFASVLGIYRAGAVPVLADIDPATGLLDFASVKRCMSEKVRAVLLVHLYGQARNLEDWAAWCQASGIKLLEDCAQAHGARWRGRAVGSWGTWGAFSFYPTKNLGSPGDAGALVSDKPDLLQRAAVLRNYGQTDRYHHPVLGLNSRLDEVHAAILRERVKWLEELNRRRRTIAGVYRAGINNRVVRLMSAPETEESHVYHLFIIRTPERDRLMAHLAEAGIQSLIHYPVAAHHQEPCVTIRRDPNGLPNAERHAAECLSIPCHPHMTDEEVEEVVAAVNGFQ